MLLVMKHVLPRSVYNCKNMGFLVGTSLEHVALVILLKLHALVNYEQNAFLKAVENVLPLFHILETDPIAE